MTKTHVHPGGPAIKVLSLSYEPTRPIMTRIVVYSLCQRGRSVQAKRDVGGLTETVMCVT